MSSDERALASWLLEREDDELARLFARRGVAENRGWNDVFDAAEELLDPGSIDRALSGLPRDALAGLVWGESSAELIERGLVRPDGNAYPIVSERAASMRLSRPDAFEPGTAAGQVHPAGPAGVAAAAEEAFQTVGALTDVLLVCVAAPLSRTSTGAVTANDRRELQLRAGSIDADSVDDLAEMLHRAGLLEASATTWTAAHAATHWLESSTPQRWSMISGAFRDWLPSGVRTGTGGYLPPGSWQYAYPLEPDWPERAARLHRNAVRLGLLDSAGAETPWAVALRAGDPPDPSELEPHLPAEVDRVYLQADLTAISPGPLSPPLDLRLRRVATRESGSQAPTYRFTAESIAAGIAAGETVDGLVAFLESLSLTGIPQPLGYLIDHTPTTPRHTVRGASAQLSEDSHRPAQVRARPYDDLIARLRSAHESAGEDAWMMRELERAVRARAQIAVTVRMPDGARREFLLEATGIGGGRLRGLDRASDIERTLPVSHIDRMRTVSA